MNLSVLSTRLYECGASIAALRSAKALAGSCESVNYYFEEGSFESDTKQIFPQVSISSTSPKRFPGKSIREIYRAQIARDKADFTIVHNFDHPHEILCDLADQTPLLWMMHDASPVTGLHFAMKSLDGTSVTRYPSRKGMPQRGFFERVATQQMGFAAPSEWLTKIARHYMVGDTPVFLVRNSVPENIFLPRDKALARTVVGGRPDAFTVLFFAGRGAMERKNLLVLMKALELLPDPALQVLVIGGMPPSDIKLDNRCLFLPNFQQQRDPVRPSLLYNAADLFLLPSLVDNLPNTMLESYFCGTPVLASRAGGSPEMMIENETGWLFDPRSPAELAEKLAMLMKMRNFAGFGEKGRAFVQENFSEDQSRESYLAAMEHIEGLTPGRPMVQVPQPPKRPKAPAEAVYEPDPQPISFNDAFALHRSQNPDSHMAVYRRKWNPGLSERKWISTAARMASLGHPIRENEERILRWKNAYKGERAFLIGNGPSLNKCDISHLRNEITIGVNSIFLKKDELGGLPTHYVVEDFFVAEDRAQQINALRGTNKWFGNYLSYCLEDPEAHWLNVRMRYDDYRGFPYFSQDAARQMWVGGSVTYICMQLAFYFGVKELYLIGFDHHYVIPETTDVAGNDLTSLGDDPNHFDKTYFGKGLRWHDPKTERMELGYAKAGRMFEEHGRKIYNATVGGHLEVLERKDYREIFGPDAVRESEPA